MNNDNSVPEREATPEEKEIFNAVKKKKRKPEDRTYNKKYNRKLLRGVIKAQTGKSKLVNAIFHRRNGGTEIERDHS